MKDLKQTGIIYEDKVFPADHESIGPIEKTVQYGKLDWKRAKDIYGKQLKFYLDGIQRDDILQGNIGDCYFLSTLITLASE